jgi:hypothetical protein
VLLLKLQNFYQQVEFVYLGFNWDGIIINFKSDDKQFDDNISVRGINFSFQ